MADDRKKQGARDRAAVASNEPYEVGYFAKKHGITRKEAQALIDRIGNDREMLDAAAQASAGDNASTAPRPRRRSKASATKAGDADSKTGATPAKPTTRRRAASTSTTVPAAAIATTVSEAAAETAQLGASAARTATKAVKGTSRVAARKAAKAPSAARRAVDNAVEGVKSAVSGRAAGLVGIAAAGVVTGLAANLARKAIVQAPSALAGDWLEALKAEHRMALGLFDLLQATGDEDTGKRSALLVQLKHALGKHAFTEENVIYPALRAWGDKADADKLNHDHGYVKQYLYDLEEMDNASPDFSEKVAAFRADLEAHIREEESAIFPPLHEALGETANARVTALANKEGFKLA